MENLSKLSTKDLINISGGECDAKCQGYRVGRTLGALTAGFLNALDRALDIIS